MSIENLNLKDVLFKNTGIQMFAYLVSLFIGLLTSIVLSRYLGVERFGQFNYIFAFFYFFLTLNDFGINTVIVREISQHRDQAGQIVGSILCLKLLVAVFTVGFAWVTISLMKFQGELAQALFLYALILPLIALELPGVIFPVVLKMQYPSLFGIFNRIFGFLLLILAVWKGYGLLGLVAALGIAELAFVLLIFYYSRSFVHPVLRFSLGLWKKILRSSITIGITGLFVALVNRVDFIMLERMTDLKQVGLYSAAYKLTNLLESFPLMVMGTVYPLISKYATEDLSQLRTLYRKSILLLSAVALPMGIIITCLAPSIIRVTFGNGFIPAGQALQILVWSTVFIYLAISGGNLLISVGKEKVNLCILAPATLINIGLNFLWIPRLGFLGAATATTITYFFILSMTIIAVELYFRQKCVGLKL